MEEGGFSESSSVAAPPSLREDLMEGLLATRARAKEAQASGVELHKEILDLIHLGESIRHGIGDHIPANSSDSGSQTEQRVSAASFSSVLTALSRECSFYLLFFLFYGLFVFF